MRTKGVMGGVGASGRIQSGFWGRGEGTSMNNSQFTNSYSLSRRGFLIGGAAITAGAFAALAGCSTSEQSSGEAEAVSNPVPEAMATDANPQVIVVS